MDLSAFDAVDPAVVIAAVVAVVVAVVVALLLLGRSRSRKREFEDRFGPEYELTVRRTGSRRRAEADLERRLERRAGYAIHALEAGQRERFRARWDDLQASFVDGPESAARGAVTLVAEVAAVRGYPEDVDRCLDDLSVDHPDLVAAVRRGQSAAGDRGRTSMTERHRTVVLNARTLLERLLADGEAEAVAAPPPAALEDVPSRHDEPVSAAASADSEADSEADAGDAGDSGDDGGGDSLLGPDGRPLAWT